MDLESFKVVGADGQPVVDFDAVLRHWWASQGGKANRPKVGAGKERADAIRKLWKLSADEVELATGTVYVPPYKRVNEQGTVENVDGYWRTFEIGIPNEGEDALLGAVIAAGVGTRANHTAPASLSTRLQWALEGISDKEMRSKLIDAAARADERLFEKLRRQSRRR